jgi:hypothetical protein
MAPKTSFREADGLHRTEGLSELRSHDCRKSGKPDWRCQARQRRPSVSYARLYKNVLGARIKLVSGYPGTNEITLAMERGEVDGICGLSWGTIKIAHPQWMRDASVNFLLQAGLKKDAELPDVPLVSDLMDDPEKKQVLYLHFAPQGMGRPFAAPPGLPADRKAALIKAFDDAMRDPELLAEAGREKMDISPMTGDAIDALLKELYATPADVVAKAVKAIYE